MKIVRLLSPVEKRVMLLTLNFMVSFKTVKKLQRDDLRKAIEATMKKTPFLRMKILKEDENNFSFVEKDANEANDYPIEWKTLNEDDINSKAEFNDWHTNLNTFSSIKYETNRTMFYIELWEIGQQYRLYLSLNHSGCDTRSSFAIIKDLLKYLDLISSGHEVIIDEKKPFLDVHKDLKHPFNIDSLKSEPIYECPFQHYINKLEHRETNAANMKTYDRVAIITVFRELNKDTSKSLLENCKLNGTTLQGVMSVLSAIWLINEKLGDDFQAPIDFQHVVLIDLRYHLGLQSDDVCKASSHFYIRQTIDLDSNLWQLAAELSNKIQLYKKEREVLKVWAKCLNSIDYPLASFIASNIGIVSLGQDQLVNIKLDDTRFKLGFDPDVGYTPDDVRFEDLDNYHTLYAFTFEKRLLMSMDFNFPSMSVECCNVLADNICKLMMCFSQTKLNSEFFTVRSALPLLTRFASIK